MLKNNIFSGVKFKSRYGNPAEQNIKSGVFVGYKPDQIVAANFMEAVKINPDDAWAFVSKVYTFKIDLKELQELLIASPSTIKWVTKASYSPDPKNCITRSLYVKDPLRNRGLLLHLRIIKECTVPGFKGTWKICGVEQEECVRI